MRNRPEFALRYADERYGGTQAYLQQAGLTPSDLHVLRVRLIARGA